MHVAADGCSPFLMWRERFPVRLRGSVRSALSVLLPWLPWREREAQDRKHFLHWLLTVPGQRGLKFGKQSDWDHRVPSLCHGSVCRGFVALGQGLWWSPLQRQRPPGLCLWGSRKVKLGGSPGAVWASGGTSLNVGGLSCSGVPSWLHLYPRG